MRKLLIFFILFVFSMVSFSGNEVEEYVFNKEEQIVVDPSTEKLKNEFKGVKRSYIPINAIVRIDEVLESGEAKIKKNKSDISPFPINIQPQSKKD